MKLEVGMYVRFDDGTIVKLIDIKRYKTKEDIYYFDKELDWNEDRSCNDNTIYEHQFEYLGEIKSRFEPIDLIEVGDIITFKDDEDVYRIISIPMKEMGTEDFYLAKNFDGYTEDMFVRYEYMKEHIKSIVTKEQFESISYKVVN